MNFTEASADFWSLTIELDIHSNFAQNCWYSFLPNEMQQWHFYDKKDFVF